MVKDTNAEKAEKAEGAKEAKKDQEEGISKVGNCKSSIINRNSSIEKAAFLTVNPFF